MQFSVTTNVIVISTPIEVKLAQAPCENFIGLIEGLAASWNWEVLLPEGAQAHRITGEALIDSWQSSLMRQAHLPLLAARRESSRSSGKHVNSPLKYSASDV